MFFLKVKLIEVLDLRYSLNSTLRKKKLKKDNI